MDIGQGQATTGQAIGPATTEDLSRYVQQLSCRQDRLERFVHARLSPYAEANHASFPRGARPKGFPISQPQLPQPGGQPIGAPLGTAMDIGQGQATTEDLSRFVQQLSSRQDRFERFIHAWLSPHADPNHAPFPGGVRTIGFPTPRPQQLQQGVQSTEFHSSYPMPRRIPRTPEAALAAAAKSRIQRQRQFQQWQQQLQTATPQPQQQQQQEQMPDAPSDDEQWD